MVEMAHLFKVSQMPWLFGLNLFTDSVSELGTHLKLSQTFKHFLFRNSCGERLEKSKRVRVIINTRPHNELTNQGTGNILLAKHMQSSRKDLWNEILVR